jgi:hypothetical protein
MPFIQVFIGGIGLDKIRPGTGHRNTLRSKDILNGSFCFCAGIRIGNLSNHPMANLAPRMHWTGHGSSRQHDKESRDNFLFHHSIFVNGKITPNPFDLMTLQKDKVVGIQNPF